MQNRNVQMKIKDCLNDETLIEANNCTHSLRIDSLCAICGAEILKGTDLVPVLHHTDRVFQTSEEARKLQKIRNKQLNEEKKMILILDLDQTILHTTLWKIDCDFTFSISSTMFYVKLRPHLNRFLEKISKMFEIHIYTMGTREYVTEICKAIDPNGIYFGDRIVSRNENFNELKKSIERITCISRNVVIIDDRADVWNYSKNLVLIRPFWYRDKMNINDTSGEPLYLEISKKKSDDISSDQNLRQSIKDSADYTKIESNIEVNGNNEEGPSLNSNLLVETASNDDVSNAVVEHPHPTTVKSQKILSTMSREYSPEEKAKLAESINDKELLKMLKILKSVHRKYFECKKRASKILRLVFMKNIKIASKIEHFPLIIFSGATVDLENPQFVLEDQDLAEKCKAKNIRLVWIYECIYRRRMVPTDSYVISDFSVTDDYQALLESEFFG
ncbi:FCP1-like phosphatase, phosphatase domain-containing protein [Vittaforma corneae ATCC 50505]|uniref:protein-serine/threonine phosphatase n=1 Tax=Vittaforma corneae (strain ATCC 50505) TaxID=993615 RepID=L2GQ48_VITCO|nr:FCP1-like phosphatase, phosphatase domain-containing protein [Vittaforma corneae ATCC 50505]ELA42600.1 FCP1-like phosphatase, phosphatase domain-containing protein [Vittaforma corneae ATCC 50505]